MSFQRVHQLQTRKKTLLLQVQAPVWAPSPLPSASHPHINPTAAALHHLPPQHNSLHFWITTKNTGHSSNLNPLAFLISALPTFPTLVGRIKRHSAGRLQKLRNTLSRRHLLLCRAECRWRRSGDCRQWTKTGRTLVGQKRA